jgi:phosphoglycolate phosphatase-like HAD superfamily hydrolase
MFKIAILWDVDGTLSNSHDLCFDCTNKVLKKHGREAISEETYHQGTRFTTPRRMAWHATNNPDDEIGDIMGKEFDDMYVTLVSANSAPLYQGMQDLFQTFQKDYPQVTHGALSNACSSYVIAVLKENKIDSHFGVALGADNVPAAKPAPDGLIACSTQLQVPITHCVYVGDSPTDGIAAKRAGMKSVGVTWGSHIAESVEPNFTLTVHSIEELQVVLRQQIEDMLPNNE